MIWTRMTRIAWIRNPINPERTLSERSGLKWKSKDVSDCFSKLKYVEGQATSRFVATCPPYPTRGRLR